MLANYILIIDPNSNYDIDKLKQKLDLCVDWTRLFACTYLLNSTSTYEELYVRFKKILNDNKFFISKLDLNKNEYTGWLKSSSWDRIKEFKNNAN